MTARGDDGDSQEATDMTDADGAVFPTGLICNLLVPQGEERLSPGIQSSSRYKFCYIHFK